MGVTVSNIKIVQNTIFHWNPWTTNWIMHAWSRQTANFGTQCTRTTVVHWNSDLYLRQCERSLTVLYTFTCREVYSSHVDFCSGL